MYLANGFAEAGHRTTLVLCSGGGDFDAELRGELRDDVAVATLTARRFAKRITGQVATWRKLRRWIDTTQPDVVLGTANNVAWLSGLAIRKGKGKRPRLFVKTTNPILRKADGPLLTAIRRKGYARLFDAADGVLTLSHAESRLLASQFPRQAERFRAVFNPYLTDAFLKQGTAGERAAEPPLIVGIGRLAPQKNFARAIGAFARSGLRAARQARLRIAGDGPQRAALEALVRELSLGDGVAMPGFARDVPGLLRRATRFLMSSEYEGLPAVVIEALGSGCPVVTTDCFPAARELLEDLAGCRVCGFDEAELAEALVASLSETPDESALRDRACDYTLASATASHLAAMGL